MNLDSINLSKVSISHTEKLSSQNLSYHFIKVPKFFQINLNSYALDNNEKITFPIFTNPEGNKDDEISQKHSKRMLSNTEGILSNKEEFISNKEDPEKSLKFIQNFLDSRQRNNTKSYKFFYLNVLNIIHRSIQHPSIGEIGDLLLDIYVPKTNLRLTLYFNHLIWVLHSK